MPRRVFAPKGQFTAWSNSVDYGAGDVSRFGGTLWAANSAIPKGTTWAAGQSGATWRPLLTCLWYDAATPKKMVDCTESQFTLLDSNAKTRMSISASDMLLYAPTGIKCFEQTSSYGAIYGPDGSSGANIYATGSNATLAGRGVGNLATMGQTAFVVFLGNTDIINVNASNCNARFVWGSTLSDQRHKTPLADFPDELLDAWGKHVRWGSYKMLNEGDEAKTRCGLIAQAVIAAFEEADINPFDWHIVSGEDGFIGVTYAHCDAIEHAYVRRQLKRLEEKLNAA